LALTVVVPQVTAGLMGICPIVIVCVKEAQVSLTELLLGGSLDELDAKLEELLGMEELLGCMFDELDGTSFELELGSSCVALLLCPTWLELKKTSLELELGSSCMALLFCSFSLELVETLLLLCCTVVLDELCASLEELDASCDECMSESESELQDNSTATNATPKIDLKQIVFIV